MSHQVLSRDASTSEQLPHKNDSDLNDSDLNHQLDHGDIFVDEFTNFDEANDYPDCSSELNLEVNNAYDKDSCGNDDILESTSDESNTLCTDSDYEAGLSVDAVRSRPFLMNQITVLIIMKVLVMTVNRQDVKLQ